MLWRGWLVMGTGGEGVLTALSMLFVEGGVVAGTVLQGRVAVSADQPPICQMSQVL